MDIRLVEKQIRYNKNRDLRKRWWFIRDCFLSGNVSGFCSKHGMKRSYYYFWFNRLRRSGWKIESLLNKSRRPRRSPHVTKPGVVDRILKERKRSGRGSSAIGAALGLAASTVGKVLKREGMILDRSRRNKRPKHTKRYELETPGQVVQVDVKYVPKVSGPQYYQFTAIDDCTRWRFADQYENKSVDSTKDFVNRLIKKAPFPIQCIQTDHGSEFTNKMFESSCTVKDHPKEHLLDRICRENGIRHKLIAVGQCEINGKVERSHRIDDQEFYQRTNWKTFAQLKRKFRRWIRRYNVARIHGALHWKTPQRFLDEKLTMTSTSV